MRRVLSRLGLIAGTWGAVIAATASLASAQSNDAANFPSRPIKIVVPFTPGGPTDITARVIGEKLQAAWGQPVLVENRPGGGSNIGADIVAKSAPDGYTVVLGVTGSHGINISLYKKMPYHPLRDFEPITQATSYPNAIIVHPSHPANTLQELLTMAKKEPGKIPFAHDGTGTGSHLGMVLVLHAAGVSMQPVPYKGSAPIMNDVIGQQIPVGITGIISIMPHHKAGRLKVLGLTSAQRIAAAPELPTIAEQGFPAFEAEPWSGFFAPRGTPRPIVDKLADGMISAMKHPDVVKRMSELGTPLVASRPDVFRAFVEKEIAKWAEAVKVSGASLE